MKAHGDLLVLRSTGAFVEMTMKNLVKFIEDDLRTADRYFTVDALRISYPYIAYDVKPQLQVRMLITQAIYKTRSPGGRPATGAPAADGAPGIGAGLDGVTQAQQLFRSMKGRGGSSRRAPAEEPGVVGKAWKWFKRTVLYTN